MSRQRKVNTHTAAAPNTPAGESITHDVLIIGAGLAGIHTAYSLQTRMPHLSFAILEERSDIGGTWDIFRYPGVRTDSDMYTYGFTWHPWRYKLLGDGDEVKSYLHECVSTHGLDKRLSLKHKVMKADWSSETQRWTVQADHNGHPPKTYVAKWLILSTGLFDYHKPFPAVIPGIENFQGKVIHPQFWPAEYDYTDKKMVVIGSGSTAISLFPALAKNGAKHVTMLQRSPSYVVSIPIPDTKPSFFGRLLPAISKWLNRMSWFFTLRMTAFMCAHFPSLMRKFIAGEALKQLPAKTPLDPHFVPAYNPWDQRMCYCPDGDFFRALHSDNADVVTGTIQTVTEDGIRLDDGRALDADVIVTATGWRMHFGGGIPITVDGEPVLWPSKLIWNGSMVQDVPNMFYMWGYTNASWTTGAEETANIACRLLKHMERQGNHVAVPRAPDGFDTETHPLWKLSSTYAAAGNQTLPKYGSKGPWRPREDIVLDMMHASWGNVTNGLQFLS